MGTPASFAERFPPPERPWTEEYVDLHRRVVVEALNDHALRQAFQCGSRLPPGYGIGFDERVVELPWLLAQRLGGRVLDAGSALNHLHVLERLLPRIESLHVVTLAPEENAFTERGVSYIYEDLRSLPYRDSWFDSVACISTIEHVGMDNTAYGAPGRPAADPAAEAKRALLELLRVLRPGGTLLITVPYGAREDHGWFRQYGRKDVEELVAACGGRAVLRVFAYSREGWQVSDLDAASGARYRDFTRDPRPVADLAAAARAVVCICVTRD